MVFRRQTGSDAVLHLLVGEYQRVLRGARKLKGIKSLAGFALKSDGGPQGRDFLPAVIQESPGAPGASDELLQLFGGYGFQQTKEGKQVRFPSAVGADKNIHRTNRERRRVRNGFKPADADAGQGSHI